MWEAQRKGGNVSSEGRAAHGQGGSNDTTCAVLKVRRMRKAERGAGRAKREAKNASGDCEAKEGSRAAIERRTDGAGERGTVESKLNKVSGDNSLRDPPVPIPNTEVKPQHADRTWLETARESRSSPDSIEDIRMNVLFLLHKTQRQAPRRKAGRSNHRQRHMNACGGLDRAGRRSGAARGIFRRCVRGGYAFDGLCRPRAASQISFTQVS